MKFLGHFSLIFVLLFTGSAFAYDSTSGSTSGWVNLGSTTLSQKGISLFLVGRSRAGAYVNTSGGRVQLLRNDIIDLRGEVRDQNNLLVRIVPLRLRQSFFPDFQANINYRDELEIITGRSTYYPTSVTVEGQWGFLSKQITIDVSVAGRPFPGWSRQGARDMAIRAYYGILLRQPDTAGLEYNARNIYDRRDINGLAQVLRLIAQSDEFINITRRNHSSFDISNAMFRNFLNRYPSQNELRETARAIDYGDAAGVIERIVLSPEFADIVSP